VNLALLAAITGEVAASVASTAPHAPFQPAFFAAILAVCTTILLAVDAVLFTL